MTAQPSKPMLAGVHHTARPTWLLGETVRFYRDVLELRLTHVISARGWGPEGHPDFLHFFFESGRGSTIAFFYYLGAQRPEYLEPRDCHTYRATHTAWRVDDAAELLAWKSLLEGRGVAVSPVTRHETIESIYFEDPNGYTLEITCDLRALGAIDARDGARTLEAALRLETELGRPARSIDEVWRAKGQSLTARAPS